MNASYKIVLLGAFVLFAAVVGYYVLSGEPVDRPTSAEPGTGDEYAQQDPPNKPSEGAPREERPRLELAPPPAVEPAAGQETIGQTEDELPEAPVIAPSGPGGDSVASADPIRPDPGAESNEPPATDPAAPDEERAAPDEAPRPGPGSDLTGPADETTESQPEETTPETDPAPPARPAPPDPATVPRNYTVQSGDTFASIATEFYGDEAAWFEIAQANPSVDPKRLQVGQVIVLPNRGTVVREREEVQPPAPGKDQNYTVRPGDNLSRIAKKFYGDSEAWDLIYARNRQLIGPRPDALKVGMELVIPQAYEGAE